MDTLLQAFYLHLQSGSGQGLDVSLHTHAQGLMHLELGSEVICSQTGIVDLQDNLGILSGDKNLVPQLLDGLAGVAVVTAGLSLCF